MQKRSLDRFDGLLPDDTVKVKSCGNIVELVWCEHLNRKARIVKVDKDHYYLADDDNKTLYEFQHIQSRIDDKNSIRASLARLRDIINTNVSDVSCCRWCTFTYAENMTDTNKLYLDWKKCVRSLRRIYGDFEYIIAVEPQGRGAWHIHAILIFSHKAPYMENSVVAQAWGQGFVNIKRLDDVDNVGAYLTAYLGDMELPYDEDPGQFDVVKTVDYIDDFGMLKTKRYIKGARLKLYPPGMNIYRASRGIRKPDVSYMPNAWAEKKVSSAKLTYEKTVALVDDDCKLVNTINYRYYNTISK